MSIEAVQRELREFVAEREWAQFHSPENLAKSVSIEAAELLEHFQWGEPSDDERDEVLAELADVLTYCFLLADRLDADPVEIIRSKLATTRAKYPVEKARGRSAKYDEL
ncbi:nucleotide pyrophosphohydrolase [Microbacterium sp.]|uniref:nucleotide pyrophosphohydrolase n=1 Tax=Microbacterium sp. TaxID=51671 RepID=UPI003F98D346